MSNHWALLCRDCDQRFEFDWNHGGDKIQELIPHMANIAKMAPVDQILSYRYGGIGLEFEGIIHFAERHHDHNLIAIDEYGVLYGDCTATYICDCCGTYLKCKKPKDHEGDHGPRLEA